MLLRKSILSLIALFMSVSGMPVYAEQAPEPEVMERKDDTAAFTEAESAVGIKKLYAEEPGTLMSGPDFNEAIKSLAAGSSKYYLYPDSLIKTVEVVDALPSGKSTNAEIEAAINHSTIRDVSKDNNRSYLAWWDAETLTIYLYSKSGDIVLNPDSSYIFNNCYSLTTLDVSDWDTSSVTNMIYMFSDCKNLTTLDVSKWNRTYL